MLTYFAYGSNMLPARLTARCPGARVIGTARAADHDLRYWMPGACGSGKATLIANPGSITHGILYHLPSADLPALDRAEGLGTAYARHDHFHVMRPDGTPLDAITYLALQTDPAMIPFDWYRDLCLAGARLHALPTGHLTTASRPDPNPNRPARLIALQALDHRRPKP